MQKISRHSFKKEGYRGSEMWTAHRLEGVVKNKAIKPTKKKKQKTVKPQLVNKNHNPDKLAKKPIKEFPNEN